MEILFSTDALRKKCSNLNLMIRHWGPKQARRLGQRLDDLRAAPCLETIFRLPGRCHPLRGELKGKFSLDLEHPQRLIFEAADDPLPRKSDGGLDYGNIRAVRIIGVKDTHG